MTYSFVLSALVYSFDKDILLCTLSLKNELHIEAFCACAQLGDSDPSRASPGSSLFLLTKGCTATASSGGLGGPYSSNGGKF